MFDIEGENIGHFRDVDIQPKSRQERDAKTSLHTSETLDGVGTARHDVRRGSVELGRYDIGAVWSIKLFCQEMKRYRFPFVLFVAIAICHLASFFVDSRGRIHTENRDYYCIVTSGKVLLGTMYIGDLGEFLDRPPMDLNVFRASTPIEGLGPDAYWPILGGTSIVAPILPGFAFPILSLLAIPMAVAILLRRLPRYHLESKNAGHQGKAEQDAGHQDLTRSVMESP